MLSNCAIASRLRKRLLSITHPHSRETEAFYVHVANGSVTFQMKDHHATRESARQEAKNYLRKYEVLNARQYGYQVSFEFCDAEVIDRNPPLPGEPRLLKIILLVSQNHTFGGCAANSDLPHLSERIKVYFPLLKTGEKVLISVVYRSNPYHKVLIGCGSVCPSRHAEQSWNLA